MSHHQLTQTNRIEIAVLFRAGMSYRDIGKQVGCHHSTVWQMHHFYAIAIFRAKEYKRKNVPSLVVAHGSKITSHFMLGYSFLFIMVVFLSCSVAHLSLTFLIVMLVVSIVWLVINGLGLFSC
jgi:protoheme IX farnesyltransferase